MRATLRAPLVAERSSTAARAAVRPMARPLAIFLCAAVVDCALWLFLYLRPAPHGSPFALDPAHYVFHAMFYGLWAQLALASPFVLYARFVRAPRTSLATCLQVALTTALLLLGALDREFQRFLGMHVSFSWLSTYASVERTPGVIWDSLARDQGGAWSSLWGLGAALSVALLAPLFARGAQLDWLERRPARIALAALLVIPTVLWNWVPGGKFRQNKVCPALVLLVRELRAPGVSEPEPARLARDIETVQRHLASQEPDPSWRFVDARYPLRRRYTGERPVGPAVPPSFIVLQLETFRAKDMKSMNPALEGPAPTPFLDALARDPRSAFWQRYYANGVPTVHAFMALHASLLMHPTRSIPSEATVDFVEGFPGRLREQGYRTLHFTGSDPDWDSQRVWLDRWYDEVHFTPDDRERDRATFRRAARRIREVAESGRPFLAYLSSISNHTPFHMPEPELAITDGKSTIDALHNTMRYTDDVVRELYTTLKSAPGFENTIWIIVGDHGFDLGDRGESGGHANLRHETTWVPLIVHGADPRLPRGPQACVASHIDIAPTVLELASDWGDNSYLGHSLLHKDCARADALIVRGPAFAHETPAFSLFQPEEGGALVYGGRDLVQQRALSQVPARISHSAAALADAYREVTRYVVDHDRIAPRPAVADACR